ncbi:MAG: FIST C-terminal domain-containing protein [Nannocystis sp.]|nr:FIST C-terminal domain-containing protein [Nannocystis sp.]
MVGANLELLMKLATATSTLLDPQTAARDAYSALEAQLGAAPSLLVVYPTASYDVAEVAATLGRLAPGVPMHGATSCLGVMSGAGFTGEGGVGLGLLGILDPEGAYGVAARPLGDDPRAAGRSAIAAAIAAVEREGEPPALVWLAADPGSEEAVIAGIQEVLGPNVPIAGGSAADNDVGGAWSQICGGEALRGSVVVTAMYPSTGAHFAFHSGYSASESSGVVTRAEGRVLYEIDGRPAAEVYNEWTGGILGALGVDANVLGKTTLHPLGRVAGEYGGVPYHRLSHPDSVRRDGALTLFTEVFVGERLIQMVGTRESLISRAGRVVRAAMSAGNLSQEELAGALVIYCAGCMLTIQGSIDEVARGISSELAGAPFLGTFTFGEQGCFANNASYHGNLMISVAVFERG